MKQAFNKLGKYQLIALMMGLSAYGATSSLQAEDGSRFVWNQAAIDMILSGDAKQGKALAKKGKCSKCHGDEGISDEDDTPSIAGQTVSYNYKQMVDYKTKARDDKTMRKQVRDFSHKDLADMAAYYATLPAEPSQSGGKNPPKLVTEGDKERLLLPCNVCHGKDGEGFGFESPALMGQKREHFVELMTSFQESDRENDHYGRMRFIASQLTEEEIEQLADYYSAKPLEE